eukprot:m.161936 g.161936  ORF g.161936 m.161936 type:complete len:804 (+) comp15194_c0_seq3:191-2602(+)
MDLVRQGMSGVRVPGPGDLVYKDECMFSFDTPLSPEGLAVNLNSWRGYGEDFIAQDHKKTGNKLYLLQKHKEIPKTDEEKEADKLASEKMAAEGKIFIADDTTTKLEKKYSLLIMPEKIEIDFPNAELPMIVTQACEEVIKHEAAGLQVQASAFVDDFQPKESKYAKDLVQLPSEGKTIGSDPSGWKCMESGVTENLWLNLSTGFIGSGRRHWDGSGGNGAAERNWEATGKKYPLVVKLGTITPHSADVFSYAQDENDMVIDPLLPQHLAHWGIDIMKLEKTEKTVAELQVTLNLEHDWSKITEGNDDLEELYGSGFVGISNLGNSCYINSVVQVLFSLPEVQEQYVKVASNIFESCSENPVSDMPTQMAKLGVGLLTEKYGSKESNVRIRPVAFRALVSQGHSEFSTVRQQDAAEYFQHLLEVMERSERTTASRLGGNNPTSSLFEATIEERIQCGESKKVAYKMGKQNVIGIKIPIEAALNGKEYQEYQERKRLKTTGDKVDAVVAKVPFSACLAQLFGEETISDFYSTAMKRNTFALKRVRFNSFPQYLVLRMDRYYLTKNWEPMKMEVEVELPEELNLEEYRATGKQEDEELLPEESASNGNKAPEIDMNLVKQLMDMGFSENGCKRAVAAVKGSSIEAASEWIFSHMEDADFNSPLEEEKPAATGPSEESIVLLTSLGFTAEQARAALIATDNNSERAADWLFSHVDTMEASVAEVLGRADSQPKTDSEPVKNDGPGNYTLHAIISHLGKNTGTGHYVCHIKKGNDWVIFNDEKVGKSKRPPLDVGYLYIYKRNSSAK